MSSMMPNTHAFIQRLQDLAHDPRGRGQLAELRRSLAYEPGTYIRAFPVLESPVRRYISKEDDWWRKAAYLVAGLWASANVASVLARTRLESGDADETGEQVDKPAGQIAETLEHMDRSKRSGRSLGYSVAQLDLKRKKRLGSNQEVSSVEQRFIVLLDGDTRQLPYRLRQMVQLLKAEDVQVDWAQLLNDLLYWDSQERRVQKRWARAFYETLDPQ